MASNHSDFLLEDLMVKSSFEFTLSAVGGGNIHGRLSTAENDKVLFGCNSGAVQGSIGSIGFHNFEIAGINELENSQSSVFQISSVTLTLAVLSLDAVMKYVLSGDHWMSLMVTSLHSS